MGRVAFILHISNETSEWLGVKADAASSGVTSPLKGLSTFKMYSAPVLSDWLAILAIPTRNPKYILITLGNTHVCFPPKWNFKQQECGPAETKFGTQLQCDYSTTTGHFHLASIAGHLNVSQLFTVAVLIP